MRCYNSGSTIVTKNFKQPEFNQIIFKQKEIPDEKNNNNLRGNHN
jgi:hypothetical protein